MERRQEREGRGKALLKEIQSQIKNTTKYNLVLDKYKNYAHRSDLEWKKIS